MIGDVEGTLVPVESPGNWRLSAVAEVGVISSPSMSSSSSGIADNGYFSSIPSSSSEGLDPSVDPGFDFESLRTGFVDDPVPG